MKSPFSPSPPRRPRIDKVTIHLTLHRESSFQALTEKPPRPLGVTILGIWLVALAFLSIIPAIFWFFSVVWLIAAVGVLTGAKWGRDMTMIVTILSVLGSLALISIGAYLFAAGPPIGVLMIYYLTRPWVKAFFDQGLAARNSSLSKT